MKKWLIIADKEATEVQALVSVLFSERYFVKSVASIVVIGIVWKVMVWWVVWNCDESVGIG